MSQVVLFLQGDGFDSSGRHIDQILEMPDYELEETHDYIQWIFPLPEPSSVNVNAPLLSLDEISLIKDDLIIQNNLEKAVICMENFYNKNDHWLGEYDHNHFRITRILKSLTLLHKKEMVHRFYNTVMNRINNSNNSVNQESLTHWENILIK